MMGELLVSDCMNALTSHVEGTYLKADSTELYVARINFGLITDHLLALLHQ